MVDRAPVLRRRGASLFRARGCPGTPPFAPQGSAKDPPCSVVTKCAVKSITGAEWTLAL